MILVSSACSSRKLIRNAIEELYSKGFSDIELTGGTHYYQGLYKDILELKKVYNLNFLLHNYFPPPPEDFVLNLASPNESISRKSIELCKNAIDFSRFLGAEKISFHAGFRVDFSVDEIGKEIQKINTYDRELSFSQLINNCNLLLDYAEDDMDIYLENNVYSLTNAQNFGMNCPFFLMKYEDFIEIRNNTDVRLLVDVAHLKVSANTLGFSFKDELDKMIKNSDYIHISENDGYYDQNRPFFSESSIIKHLSSYNLSSYILTLEIYHSIDYLRSSYDIIKNTL